MEKSKDMVFYWNGEVLNPIEADMQMKRDGVIVKAERLGEKTFTRSYRLGTAVEKPYTIVWFPDEISIELTLPKVMRQPELEESTWRMELKGKSLDLFCSECRPVKYAPVFGDDPDSVDSTIVHLLGTRPRSIEEVR